MSRDLDTDVRGSFVRNGQKLEMTQMSFNRRTGKQTGTFSWGILLRGRKKGTTEARNYMNESQNNYANWKKSDQKKREHIAWSYLCRKCRLSYNDREQFQEFA